jgi:hypothetical protein
MRDLQPNLSCPEVQKEYSRRGVCYPISRALKQRQLHARLLGASRILAREGEWLRHSCARPPSSHIRPFSRVMAPADSGLSRDSHWLSPPTHSFSVDCRCVMASRSLARKGTKNCHFVELLRDLDSPWPPMTVPQISPKHKNII